MMYRNRMLTGILLAVVLAGGMGILVTQAFPSGGSQGLTTNTMVETSTATATSMATSTAVSTTSQVTSTISGPTTTATMVATTTETATVTATSVSTATYVSSATSTSSTATVTSTTTTATSTTCEAQQYCGVLSWESPSIVAANASSGYSTVTFTLVNGGNLNLTEIQVGVNGQQAAAVLGIGAGQTVTYFIRLSPDISITAGTSYQVSVSSTTIYGPGPSIQFAVMATS